MHKPVTLAELQFGLELTGKFIQVAHDATPDPGIAVTSMLMAILVLTEEQCACSRLQAYDQVIEVLKSMRASIDVPQTHPAGSSN